MDTLVQLAAPSQRRPPWLRIRLRTPERFHEVRRLVESQRLHTVCEEARCPNIYECWGEHGTATFMILGDVCTRRCGFCAVTTGKPAAGVDADEPRRVAEAVRDHGPAPRRHHLGRSRRPRRRRRAPLRRRDRGGARSQSADRGRGADSRLPRRRRRARRRARSAARGVLAQHGDGAAPLPRGAPGQRVRPQPGAARRRRRAARPRRVRRPRQDRAHARVGRGRRRAARRRSRASATPASRSSPSASTCSPPASTCRCDRWVHPDEFAALRDFALGLGFTHCEAGPLVRSSYHAHEHVRPLPRRPRRRNDD